MATHLRTTEVTQCYLPANNGKRNSLHKHINS